MTRTMQLEMLYKIQEELRILQENGLWEPLQEAKEKVIKVIKQIESNKPHYCVPWRGAGGDLGKCVYCGKRKQ